MVMERELRELYCWIGNIKLTWKTRDRKVRRGQWRRRYENPSITGGYGRCYKRLHRSFGVKRYGYDITFEGTGNKGTSLSSALFYLWRMHGTQAVLCRIFITKLISRVCSRHVGPQARRRKQARTSHIVAATTVSPEGSALQNPFVHASTVGNSLSNIQNQSSWVGAKRPSTTTVYT